MTRFRGFQKYAYKRQKPGYYLHDFLNTKNPLVLFANKKFVIGIVVLGLIIGGMVLAQGPLFHSQQQNRQIDTDPLTNIWQEQLAAANLDGYNTLLATYDVPAQGKSIKLAANTTTSAVAITKATVGELSLVSGKEITFQFSWGFNIIPNSGTCCNGQWGAYLTTNNTAPRSANYDPEADRNVGFLLQVAAVAPSSNQFILREKMQRDPAQPVSQGTQTCGTGSTGNCFQIIQAGINVDTTSFQDITTTLNYTGAVGQGGHNGASCMQFGTGLGGQVECDPPALNYVSTITFPWFSLNSKYYLGFYMKAVGAGPNPSAISFQAQNTNDPVLCGPCDNINLVVPSTVAVTPNIDTGGFFGPIIKALIGIGVFILANIISFGNYLGGLMEPVWAFLGSLATIVLNGLSSVIISLLNGLGSLIGDPNLGDQLVSVFTQIGSYITSLFIKINSLVSSLVTFLVDSFNFLFDVTNGLLTYWIGTVLFGILGVLVTISNVIVTVLKVFQVGFPFVVLADLLWLLSESVDHGTDGAMKWWAPHEILVVNVGKLMFILVETLSTFIYETIVEIEGGVADIKPEIAGFSP